MLPILSVTPMYQTYIYSIQFTELERVKIVHTYIQHDLNRQISRFTRCRLFHGRGFKFLEWQKLFYLTFFYSFRYTKEWLSCMVVSGIIHQDRNTDLFTMPESHKEELKVRAPFAPILAVMGKRNDLVKSCFHIGGPYGRFISLITLQKLFI